MLVLGINKGKTLSGKDIRLGGAAIAMDGEVKFSIAEERVTRQKWAGGYNAALQVALEHGPSILGLSSLAIKDFDFIAVSTCCENEADAQKGHALAEHPSLTTINHHLSHASLAYFTSGFDKSLVIVIDSGGNTFDAPAPNNEWWKYRREQHSYFIGHDGKLELVDQDFIEPEAAGIGEIYRAFTYFLGWKSAHFASKVMALSAYGDKDVIGRERMIFLENGQLKSPVKNDPRNPADFVHQLATSLNLRFGEARNPDSEILPVHCNVAAYLQDCLEWALIEKVKYLVKKHKS